MLYVGGYEVNEELYNEAIKIEEESKVKADIDTFWVEYYGNQVFPVEPTYPVKFWYKWQYWIRHKVFYGGNWMDA